jgi:hypothetical protein
MATATESKVWRVIPMGAGALMQCWGQSWLRPATTAEHEAWFDSGAYQRIIDEYPGTDANGGTHALMALLETTPANVKSFLRDFEMVTAGPLKRDCSEW